MGTNYGNSPKHLSMAYFEGEHMAQSQSMGILPMQRESSSKLDNKTVVEKPFKIGGKDILSNRMSSNPMTSNNTVAAKGGDAYNPNS
mmetsp:Transcript_12083/g.20378  ORF Transcript_12083/g.20378 Transcript_12083/m.20378 type:complete len:87 (+) Transcript_12083:1920-2180(+)